MDVALWIVGGMTALVFLVAGAVALVAPRRWLAAHGMRWAGAAPALLVRLVALLELLGGGIIAIALVLQGALAPLAWTVMAWCAGGLVVVAVVFVVIQMRRRDGVARTAAVGALALTTAILAAVAGSAWPGGVTAPTVAVPDNPLWKGDTKPDPVPAENVVLSLPKDMYRHRDAPTEWWWHIGTLRAGDRMFGFEINAASFVGSGYAITQMSVSDVEAEQHYEHTQVYLAKPIGAFDVSQWAEGDPSKDWYARLGDADGGVGGFVVTETGNGYTEAPTVTIEGDGSGASGMAILDDDGSVAQVVVLQSGSGYTAEPTVTLRGGGGSGAQVVATRNAVHMTAPQEDPTQNIEVTAVFTDAETRAEVSFDLTFSQQGRPFFVFGTGLEPSATKQSLTEDNYYFSYTRLAASGTITVDGTEFEVSGTTWMDHEYGYFGGNTSDTRVRWLLQDLQLDNGYTISNAGIIGEGYHPEIDVSVEAYATIQDADGELYYVASTITPVGELWTSPKTDRSYARQFRVEIPSFDADFLVTTRLEDQEFAVPGGSIYEGTSEVTGRILGEDVSGDAWIEQAF